MFTTIRDLCKIVPSAHQHYVTRLKNYMENRATDLNRKFNDDMPLSIADIHEACGEIASDYVFNHFASDMIKLSTKAPFGPEKYQQFAAHFTFSSAARVPKKVMDVFDAKKPVESATIKLLAKTYKWLKVQKAFDDIMYSEYSRIGTPAATESTVSAVETMPKPPQPDTGVEAAAAAVSTTETATEGVAVDTTQTTEPSVSEQPISEQPVAMLEQLDFELNQVQMQILRRYLRHTFTMTSGKPELWFKRNFIAPSDEAAIRKWSETFVI